MVGWFGVYRVQPSPYSYEMMKRSSKRWSVRLFYGCSYMFHLSGDDSRDRCIKGS